MSVNLEHFRNLIALAGIDGKIEESERATLSKIAFQKEIPMDRMNVMLKKSDEYVYFIPQNQHDREKQLKDMIFLALVDGELAKAEKNLIISVGKKLNFSEDEVLKYINESLESSDAREE